MPRRDAGRAAGDEPDSVDELLVAADRAVGVRLGSARPRQGRVGHRAATLLGVIERGSDEPDWRGDVEIKTVPVAREASGLWRVVEDPAIAMLGEGGAIAKLQRTLWLARADVDGDDATIVSWYLLEWDATVARLARRYLHDRPKGPAGTRPARRVPAQAILRGRGSARDAERSRMIVDELRIVGSTQTNVVMSAELIRVAQRALRRRPPNRARRGSASSSIRSTAISRGPR